jgi:RimJ/RimL family protein N-acetyltransferase
MIDTLTTERLRLRPPHITDAAALTAQFSDFEVAKMTASVAHPYPQLAGEMWLLCYPSARRRGLRHSFAIEHADQMIGIVSLFRGTPDAEWVLGYHLDRRSWGKGFATESCQAVMAFAANVLGAENLRAGIYSDNPASHRVIEKLGFVKEDPERVWCMARGETVDGHSYLCDLRNWPNAAEAPKDAT